MRGASRNGQTSDYWSIGHPRDMVTMTSPRNAMMVSHEMRKINQRSLLILITFY